MNIPGNNDAQRVAWLGQQRLWPVADLLLERGCISPGLAELSRQLAAPQFAAMRAQVEEDRRVVSAIAESGAPVLVLKGCLLGQTVYSDPADRFRTDLDLLTDPARVDAVEAVLARLGYRRPDTVQAAMPMRQAMWERQAGKISFSVDLHWDLRNHPALQERFSFDELLQAAQPLPALGDGALGMGRAHALLNASMHYFNDYADARPCQWLLDKDLLWRAMSSTERTECVNYARKRGLSGLLAESLVRCREQFETPVSNETIDALRTAGHSQWSTGLVSANQKRSSAYWFALQSEPGLRRKLVRLKSGLFPPASYMRRLYPEGSRLGLLGLYCRRIAESFGMGEVKGER